MSFSSRINNDDPVLEAFLQNGKMPAWERFEEAFNTVDNDQATKHICFLIERIDYFLCGPNHQRNVKYDELIQRLEPSLENKTIPADFHNRRLLVLGLLHHYQGDFKQAKKYYEDAAHLGNDYALNNLGYMYKTAQGVACDNRKAHEYHEQAAQLGNSYAMCNLGHHYQKGIGVKQDYEKAFECYECAFQLGNAYALIFLAKMYEKGLGKQQNHQKAREYLELGAQLGNRNAIFNLGYCYEKGRGVQQDLLKAKEYYQKAAMLGYVVALYKLAYLYDNSNKKIKKDYQKAFSYYEISGECGVSASFSNLANLYLDGRGATKDVAKAAKYFRLSLLLEDNASTKAFFNSTVEEAKTGKNQNVEIYYYAAMAFRDFKLLHEAFNLDADKTYQLWLDDISTVLPKGLKSTALDVMKEYIQKEEKVKRPIRAKLSIFAFEDEKIDEGFDFFQSTSKPEQLSVDDNYFLGLSLYSHQEDGIESAYPYFQQAAKLKDERAIRFLEGLASSRIRGGLIENKATSSNQMIADSQTFFAFRALKERDRLSQAKNEQQAVQETKGINRRSSI